MFGIATSTDFQSPLFASNRTPRRRAELKIVVARCSFNASSAAEWLLSLLTRGTATRRRCSNRLRSKCRTKIQLNYCSIRFCEAAPCPFPHRATHHSGLSPARTLSIRRTVTLSPPPQKKAAALRPLPVVFNTSLKLSLAAAVASCPLAPSGPKPAKTRLTSPCKRC